MSAQGKVVLGLSPFEFKLWAMQPSNHLISSLVRAGGIDYYEVLGVDPNASADDIQRAYKQEALQWHPDKVTAEQKDIATERFKVINSSYGVLSDPTKKREYDALRKTADSAGQPMPGQQVSLGKAWEIFIDFMVSAWVHQYQLSDEKAIRRFISDSGIAEVMAMWGGSGTVALVALSMAMLRHGSVLDTYRDLKDEEKVAFFFAVSLISRCKNR